ncbi:hypothetical protein AB0903_31070 [Streptomyces sp. NPDC048389]|uniref:hypothetical protein n=1 Tax=Streptomyces sp. NPDC048389 TaxID=3154622 RepID=UPI0034561E85
MMLTCCTVCHDQLPDTAEVYACEACAYRLRAMLLELPGHMPLLAELLQPGSRLPGRGGAGRAHSPMPVRLDVMDLLGPGHIVVLADPHGDQSAGIPITPLLYGWARYIAASCPSVTRDRHGTVRIQPCDGPYSRHGSDAAAWCQWLIAYLPYAVTQSWIGDMYQQIEDLIRRVRDKTDRKPQRTQRSAPCPECSWLKLVSIEGEPHIVCEACGHRLTADEYKAHSAAVLPALTALAIRIHGQAAAEHPAA